MMFRTLLIICIAMSDLSLAGARELKAQCKGAWEVDIKASVARYLASKKVEGKSERQIKNEVTKLRAFIKTAGLGFRFAPHSIFVSNKGDTRPHAVKVGRAAGKVIVFNSTQIGQLSHVPIQFRVFFQDKDHIVITSSDSKDLELYVWRRAPERGKH